MCTRAGCLCRCVFHCRSLSLSLSLVQSHPLDVREKDSSIQTNCLSIQFRVGCWFRFSCTAEIVTCKKSTENEESERSKWPKKQLERDREREKLIASRGTQVPNVCRIHQSGRRREGELVSRVFSLSLPVYSEEGLVSLSCTLFLCKCAGDKSKRSPLDLMVY